MLAYMPAQCDANRDLLAPGRGSVQAAQANIEEARADLKQIAADLKPMGSTPASTPTTAP